MDMWLCQRCSKEDGTLEPPTAEAPLTCDVGVQTERMARQLPDDGFLVMARSAQVDAPLLAKEVILFKSWTIAQCIKTLAASFSVNGNNSGKESGLCMSVEVNDTEIQLDNRRLKLKRYISEHNLHLLQEVNVTLRVPGRGGGKRGVDKKSKQTKEEMMQELSDQLATMNGLFKLKTSRNTLCEALWTTINNMKHEADLNKNIMTVKAKLLPGTHLTSINTSCSASHNSETRLSAIVKAMFFNEVTAINETRKQFTDVEAGLKEVIRYCMLTEFGNCLLYTSPSPRDS